jgi:hypothetical protein
MLPGLGHLAHEEEPAKVARLIEDAMITDRPERGQPMTLADCA